MEFGKITHTFLKTQQSVMYMLGSTGFNLNYFFVAALQSSFTVLTEKMIRTQLT
jgi:hypothetical protein